MTIQMGGNIPGRVIQVLTDFLPARLAALDSFYADGITTPSVADYFEWDRPLIQRYPTVAISLFGLRDTNVLPAGFGSRLDATYEVDVKAHVTLNVTNASDALTLQKIAHRYANAISQVLSIEKTGLETIADPTRWATMVTLRRVTFGPEPGQESGQMTRTPVVAVDVRRIES